MKKGYVILAGIFVTFACIMVAFDTTATWIGLGMGIFILYMGVDQRRHEERMARIYQQHNLGKYRKPRGLF